MKELFIIEDTLTNKISYYHIMAFMICLPLDRFYSELILVSFLIHEMIHLRKTKFSNFQLTVLLPTLIYLLTIAGAFYSSEKKQMFQDLEKQLALVCFPFIFSVTGLDLVKYRGKLLKVFALCILLTILYLYMDAFNIIRYNKLPVASLLTSSFLNHNFSLPLNLHATYLSMYAAMGATIFLKLFIASKKIAARIFYLAGLLILFMGILQLSSKAVFIASLVIINIAIPLSLQSGGKRWKTVGIIFLLLIAVIFGLSKIAPFKNRYIAPLTQDLNQVSPDVNVLEPRMVRWQSALQLIKQSPIIGHGSGSEISLLKEVYFTNKLFISFLNELNAHNQYLSFLIKTGIIGLVVFLFVLFAGLKQAITLKDFTGFSFIILVAVICLSENVLDVNKGIFFVSFFYPFLMKKG